MIYQVSGTGSLQSMGSQRVRHNLATEEQQQGKVGRENVNDIRDIIGCCSQRQVMFPS